MATKKRKFTMNVVIGNNQAVERIRDDHDLMRYVKFDTDKKCVIIEKTGLSAADLVKAVPFFISALRLVCCRTTPENDIPDNWSFSKQLMNIENYFYSEIPVLTGKDFEEWFKECIETMCYKDNNPKDKNITHKRVCLDYKYNHSQVAILVGYDWED